MNNSSVLSLEWMITGASHRPTIGKFHLYPLISLVTNNTIVTHKSFLCIKDFNTGRSIHIEIIFVSFLLFFYLKEIRKPIPHTSKRLYIESSIQLVGHHFI